MQLSAVNKQKQQPTYCSNTTEITAIKCKNSYYIRHLFANISFQTFSSNLPTEINRQSLHQQPVTSRIESTAQHVVYFFFTRSLGTVQARSAKNSGDFVS